MAQKENYFEKIRLTHCIKVDYNVPLNNNYILCDMLAYIFFYCKTVICGYFGVFYATI